MNIHAKAALGPAGRLALVEAIESGMTLRAAAAALNVAPATAHRWWHRSPGGERRGARLGLLASGPLLVPSPPAPPAERRRGGTDPARSPRDQPRARPARRDLPPRPLDDLEGACTETGSRGVPGPARQSYRRYEWSRPGALLHVDMARLARFEHPGHARHGDRARRQARRRRLRLAALRGRRSQPLRLRRTASRPKRRHSRRRARSERSPTSLHSASRRPRR